MARCFLARAADVNGDLELAVLQLINVERANNGLSALPLDMGLNEAAGVQSLGMATTPRLPPSAKSSRQATPPPPLS
jgi:hypothetical protein